ncbi:MAG: glycosyltransferase, partial [Planctomycetales bacterium]|nr:glycosyltransferase [Planctomycetales bacterium]
MTPRRIALVVRRFWPLVGGGAGLAAELAAGLALRGHAPTVLTVAWQKDWPQAFAFEEVAVERLPQAPGKLLGSWQYARALAQWLRARADRFDVVVVVDSARDAATASTALTGAGPAVVAVASAAGGAAALARQGSLCDALIAPTESVAAE